MPQMSPLNWLFLLCMFSLTYLIFMTMNYSNHLISTKGVATSSTLHNKNLHWKW